MVGPMEVDSAVAMGTLKARTMVDATEPLLAGGMVDCSGALSGHLSVDLRAVAMAVRTVPQSAALWAAWLKKRTADMMVGC